jgi:predicted metal-dependent phosphoesterase TrpH
MKHLQAKNLDLAWSDFPLAPETVSRAHIARMLVSKGYAPDRQSAFRDYLSDKALSGIEREFPSVLEGMERILAAGGLPSLAHPGRLSFFSDPLRAESFIQHLAESGLQALEAYHGDHVPGAAFDKLRPPRFPA